MNRLLEGKGVDPHIARVVQGPIDGNHTCFLEGLVGAGQSEALIGRLGYLLQRGVPGYSILVLLPDRSTTTRYRQALSGLELGPFGAVDLHTYFSLANRLVQLFWPLVAADAGFASPQQPPIFLSYETAQYIMGQLIVPLLAEGYFEGLAMRPQRVLSQLLDNLNKAAINGYPLAEVEPRLSEAWTGEETRWRCYAQAQKCIELFRGHTLQHGLLDVSLIIEVFHHNLVEKPAFWRYFTERYRHLLVDHLEETVPVAQDLIQRLLPECDSALLVGDRGGGYRVFLGVDPVGAGKLGQGCRENLSATESGWASSAITALVGRVGQYLGQEVDFSAGGEARKAIVELIQTRYRSQMIEAVAQKILGLVEQGIAPGEIAVVAPYTDGVLRFMLSEAFRVADVPFAVVRRFESLREEPVVRACLTLGALAHPEWGLRPQPFDVSEAMELALAPVDPLRAALAVRHLYAPKEGTLVTRESLGAAERERIGPAALERYDQLREWLETYRGGEPMAFDHFLRRLFGEVLSRPELSPEDAAVYSKLIASATSFRQAGPAMGLEGKTAGQRYTEMVFEGVVAAQYLTDLDVEAAPESIALVAPIYTYLLSRHVARFQFWLDIGSMGWWDPLHQPLTNPHVLSRRWKRGEQWTDAVDFAIRNQALFRLVRGLGQRCREGIYLCTSELEAGGELQDSPLLQAVQQVLREGL